MGDNFQINLNVTNQFVRKKRAKEKIPDTVQSTSAPNKRQPAGVSDGNSKQLSLWKKFKKSHKTPSKFEPEFRRKVPAGFKDKINLDPTKLAKGPRFKKQISENIHLKLPENEIQTSAKKFKSKPRVTPTTNNQSTTFQSTPKVFNMTSTTSDQSTTFNSKPSVFNLSSSTTDQSKKLKTKQSAYIKSATRSDQWTKFKTKPSAFNKSVNTSDQSKVTSLFRNNPVIPSVPHRAVQPVTESVFTEIKFADLDLHPYMVKNLSDTLKLTTATAVQGKAIPILMGGQDALVRSQTGSGKTLAFALPIVHALQQITPRITRADGVRVLVVVPSRELALQIYEVFDMLVKSFKWVVAGYLVGGEKRKAEKARLRKGVSILVGTPGRLVDHVQHTKALCLDKVAWLVLDEADRLLDLGYEKDVATLIETLGAQRQTVLLSATLTPGVERLAGLSLSNPVLVDTADDPGNLRATSTVPVYSEEPGEDASVAVLPQNLIQQYLVTPAKLRLVTLAAFILWKCKLTQFRKMLVFVATQDMVDYHTELLSAALTLRSGADSDSDDEAAADQARFNNSGIELFKLHGNMNQRERTEVFRTFRKAESGVLICTDVASRGLDLPQVDWVLQYTGPTSIADYVHRVGRTARGGQAGSAAIFLTPSEVGLIAKLEKQRIRLREVDMETCLTRLMSLDTTARSMEEAATNLQMVLENIVLAQPKMYDLGCKGFSSWVRFYSSYPRVMKDVFSVKGVHMGHYAKSFALRVAPSLALRQVRDKGSRDDPRYQKKRILEAKAGKTQKPFRNRSKVVSEYDSGLEPIKKKRKIAD